MADGDKRMQRSDMWAYFKAYAVPSYKVGRKKADKESAKNHIRYACIVNGDRLIIGEWRGSDAEFCGVYYMTPSGTAHVCRDGKEWTQGKACYLAIGGWNYWTAYTTYGYNYQCIGGGDEARAWIQDHWAKHSWFCRHPEVIRDVEHVEEHISMQRRMNAEERRKKKWTDYASSMPPLPDDFEEWARKVAFGDLEYAFGQKDSDTYYCTACGKTHKQKTWKHRGRYQCSRTGKKVKCEKVEKDRIIRRERLMLIQSHYTIDGEICSVARHFTAGIVWTKQGSTFKLYDDAILVLRFDGSLVSGDDIIYCVGNGEWDVRNLSAYRHERCFCYPEVSALAGTAYADGGNAIEAAARKGWRLNYNNLMRYWRDDPRMEYLIKGNFKRLVDDKVSGCCFYAVSLFEGTNVQEVLGVDGQSVARLRQADGGAAYLDWLRAVYMSYSIKYEKGTATIVSGKISETAIRFFVNKSISPQDVAFALNLGMSPEQIANYLKKDHGYSLSDCRWAGNKEHVTLRQWKDYLSMAEKLKLDLSRESVYKPKSIKERHDELTEIINADQRRLEAERVEAEYPAIKPVCEKIKATYEWGDGEYLVIVPEGAAEIQREGCLLRHCVGTTDRYFDRIAEEESYIMFLRKSSAPTSPWYTMEVEPGGAVRQLRTFGDDEGSDRNEAKAFLKKWRHEIAKRLGDSEREAAQISREKRLAEFEELRKNGNIIRNGKLAGKLLVEVLEADFKEYNEETA